jgi:trk system potassium uptake protein TrkH
MSLIGALPFKLSTVGITWSDAIMESSFAFATTGANIFPDIEIFPASLLLWRSLAHWAGGMGIVLLTVALVPLFGVGGFQLVKAESPGPEKEKVTPKIAATAKFLWIAYIALTMLCFVLYLIGGMKPFDALCHALTTLASGGVSTKNGGIASYNSSFIEITSIIFMLAAAINFNMFYRLYRRKWSEIFYNTELKVFLGLFVFSSVAIGLCLLRQDANVYDNAFTAFRHAAFQCASILSTTGASITNFELWPPFARSIILILMITGGCSGSTAGGIKVIRIAVLAKQAMNEIRRILFPRGVFGVRINHKVGRRDVVYGVAGFISLYALTIAITTLLLSAEGMDVFSALNTALAVIGNIGVGFGATGPSMSFGIFPNHIKWLLSFAAIAGRLELWTVFVLFTKEYWRKVRPRKVRPRKIHPRKVPD